jgi:predicted deacylase
VQFELDQIPPGTRETHWLDICRLDDQTMLQLPLLVARGARPGPTLVALGGVHGDEYEGIDAVRRVFEALDPSEMSGNFLGAPVCNPPAFAAQTRTSPIDGMNLARVFPGRADGSVSERIAHVVTHQITRFADFLIDLHSSGSFMSMPLLAGYYHADNAAGRAARGAAEHFGLPVIWGHHGASEGRSLSEPHARGIPWLYTESPSGGWLHDDVARRYANGVRSVMRLLGILPGQPERAPVEHDLSGEGNVDLSIAAPADGFLSNQVKLLELVAEGDLLGMIRNLAGESIAEIHAPDSGRLMLRREAASVHIGDLLYLLT